MGSIFRSHLCRLHPSRGGYKIWAGGTKARGLWLEAGIGGVVDAGFGKVEADVFIKPADTKVKAGEVE